MFDEKSHARGSSGCNGACYIYFYIFGCLFHISLVVLIVEWLYDCLASHVRAHNGLFMDPL